MMRRDLSCMRKMGELRRFGRLAPALRYWQVMARVLLFW
jgi:hypothetical protein